MVDFANLKRPGDILKAGKDFPINIKSSDLIGTEIIVEAIRWTREIDQDGVIKSEYAVLTGILGDQKIITTTGSSVVCPKLRALTPHLPIALRFKKTGKVMDIE